MGVEDHLLTLMATADAPSKNYRIDLVSRRSYHKFCDIQTMVVTMLKEVVLGYT
jgi:hypothetical protein